jgi:hypothetical protein
MAESFKRDGTEEGGSERLIYIFTAEGKQFSTGNNTGGLNPEVTRKTTANT